MHEKLPKFTFGRIKGLQNKGYPISEAAAELGVSHAALEMAYKCRDYYKYCLEYKSMSSAEGFDSDEIEEEEELPMEDEQEEEEPKKRTFVVKAKPAQELVVEGSFNDRTDQVSSHIDKMLAQAGVIADNLFRAVRAIDFSKELEWNNIEAVKMYLGFSKNYSDLAKTRVIYSRTMGLAENLKDGNK